MAFKIVIKGAGDLATGVAAELKERGHQIVMTELPVPLTVRRQVACSRAVYEKEAVIEGHRAVLVNTMEEVQRCFQEHVIAVLVDPKAEILRQYQPDIVVDAIMAKKNLGTTKEDAKCVIALGPGFTAGKDCHAVIETKRGETLGKPIYQGCAIANTGVPGMIGGYAKERLIKAAKGGKMRSVAQIGEMVHKGDLLAYTGGMPVYAEIDGIVRGMLQDGVDVEEGMKIGDVDPRMDPHLVYRISDKARKIGQGTAEAITKLCQQSYGVVVLAAGKSSRYGSAGENKLLAEKNGKAMYRYLLEQLEFVCAGLKVVVSRTDEILKYAREHGFETAENAQPEKGISHSLKMGMHRCLEQYERKGQRLQGILFCVCDQPNMQADTIERMLELGWKHPGHIICAGRKGNKGETDRMGNPVLLDRRFFQELEELTGDVGGKQVVKRHQDQVILCEVREAELQDIDEKTADWHPASEKDGKGKP